MNRADSPALWLNRSISLVEDHNQHLGDDCQGGQGPADGCDPAGPCRAGLLLSGAEVLAVANLVKHTVLLEQHAANVSHVAIDRLVTLGVNVHLAARRNA